MYYSFICGGGVMVILVLFAGGCGGGIRVILVLCGDGDGIRDILVLCGGNGSGDSVGIYDFFKKCVLNFYL